MNIRQLIWVICGALIGIGSVSAQNVCEGAAPGTTPAKLIQDALVRSGGHKWLSDWQFLVLEGEGTWDIGVRMQGMEPHQSEPQPLHELLALTANGKLVYDTHTRINPDAFEHLRYQYAEGDPLLIVDHLNQQAFWERSTDVPADRQRYRRTVPVLLLHEMLTAAEAVHVVGCDNDLTHLTYAPPGEPVLSVQLRAEHGRVEQVTYPLSLPLLGDSQITWKYTWQEEQALMPSGYRVLVNDRPLRTVTYQAWSESETAYENATALDESVVIPAPPAPSEDATNEASETPRPRFRELADGVFLAVNVRGGFHHLFVEFDDHVMVVDAPTGWFELQQLPAKNWAGDVTSSSAAQKLMDIVAEAIPNKPIRTLVLTHHHSDHAGGFRPLVAQGARVIASPETGRAIAAAASNDFSSLKDGLASATVAPEILPVSDRLVLQDETQTVHIMHVGDNPHAVGMLVVWLPDQGILYQSDLFMPAPMQYFPDAARIPVMQWFVKWLDRQAISPAEIRAIHGTSKVTPEQLEWIRSKGL